MTTTPAVDDITHLDFDEALPCETDIHRDHHVPADWIVTITCCFEQDFVICNDCLKALARAEYIDCTVCDTEYRDYRDLITNIRNLHA